jgi:hypothetical protein
MVLSLTLTSCNASCSYVAYGYRQDMAYTWLYSLYVTAAVLCLESCPLYTDDVARFAV